MHRSMLLALVAITGTLFSMHLGTTAAIAGVQSFSAARQQQGVLTFELRGLGAKRVRSARVTMRGKRALRVRARPLRRAVATGVLSVRMPRSWHRTAKLRAGRHRHGPKLRVTTAELTLTPTPSSGGKATTRPVGSPPLSDAEAAARVRRSSFEARPGNARSNRTMPTPVQLVLWNLSRDQSFKYKTRVTGHFTGTTDEIIQWASHKWGFDEDQFRAVAAIESWWDARSGGPAGVEQGGGLYNSTWTGGMGNLLLDSTAFAADYFGASMRNYFDGDATWLNDVERGKDYAAGDIWGCIGAHFAGRWWTSEARHYVARVKAETLGPRVWEQPGF